MANSLPNSFKPVVDVATIAVFDEKIINIFLSRDEAENKYPEGTLVELKPAFLFTEIIRKRQKHIIIPGGNGSLVDNKEKIENMSIRLRLHLDENGLTQKNFERDSGVSAVTIGKCLKGEIKKPQTKTIEAFAQALGITSIELTSRPKVLETNLT